MTEPEEPGLDPRATVALNRLLDALGRRLGEDAARHRRRPGTPWLGGAVAGLAAALAVLFFAVPGRDGGPAGSSDIDTALTWDVSADRSFAVFPTTDDDMVIIWILGENQ